MSDSDDKGFGILAGVLACAGVGFYALDFPFAVTGSSTAVGNFSACGISWDLGAFVAPIAGGLFVDPKSIAGKCYFTLTAFDALEGVCTLTLYGDKKKNTLYGIFVGITEGVDVARINGSGKIVMTK